MRLISCHHGKLVTLCEGTAAEAASQNQPFSSGFPDWDAIAPAGAFARGAIHELLTAPEDGKAMFVAMLLAGGMGLERGTEGQRDKGTKGRGAEAMKRGPFSLDSSVSPSLSPSVSHSLPRGSIIWCDPSRELYPPALAAYGFPVDRLYLLHPQSPDPKGKDLIWSIAECLRCKGVSAVVAAPPRLSRIETRRLQLAAESGGGIGLLLRHTGRDSIHHAAASRWLIRPAPGERTIQRWTIQLLHGHGGRIGHTLCLEHCRETNHLRTLVPVADRQTAEIVAKAS